MEVAQTRTSFEHYGMEREDETSDFFWGVSRDLAHIELYPGVVLEKIKFLYTVMCLSDYRRDLD
jgi:hypothetical protein